MKKLAFPIAVLALLFASCKKESPAPVNPGTETNMHQQVANLIQKGDPELYDRMYNHPDQKAPKPTIKITHGIFHYPPGSPESGTCLPNPNCVCHMTIVFPALVDDSTEIKDVTADFYQEFDKSGDGELLLNDSLSTSIKNVKSVSVHFKEDDESTVIWTLHEK
jgi:hypothetical protein